MGTKRVNERDLAAAAAAFPSSVRGTSGSLGRLPVALRRRHVRFARAEK